MSLALVTCAQFLFFLVGALTGIICGRMAGKGVGKYLGLPATPGKQWNQCEIEYAWKFGVPQEKSPVQRLIEFDPYGNATLSRSQRNFPGETNSLPRQSDYFPDETNSLPRQSDY